MLNIAAVETGFYDKGKRLKEQTINGWFCKVAESESLIMTCMERGAVKCLSFNETFISRVYQ